jgi:hypothetical protein
VPKVDLCIRMLTAVAELSETGAGSTERLSRGLGATELVAGAPCSSVDGWSSVEAVVSGAAPVEGNRASTASSLSSIGEGFLSFVRLLVVADLVFLLAPILSK